MRRLGRRSGRRREFPPGVELLLSCARTRPDAERIAQLAGGGIDWPHLVRLGALHEVTPLVYHSLRAACWPAVPTAIQEKLHEYSLANARRSLHLAGELLRLAELFEAHKIPMAPFKGPVLAASAYGDLGLREFVDLDLLVRDHDVARGRQLLIEQGYKPQFILTEAQESAFLRYACEYVLSREQDRVMVELQWQFVPRYFTFCFDPTELWQRMMTVPFGSRRILSLPPEELLLYLCVHGAKHGWIQLKWVCDVAESVRASGNLDWGLLFEQARRSGSERMLALGLCLATDLLGARIPQEVAGRVRADWVAQRLAGEVRQRLSSEEGGATGYRLALFHLRSRERLKDRARYCFRLLTTQTVFDWQFVPLPRTLWFLYYFLRPFRLVNKYWRERSTNT